MPVDADEIYEVYVRHLKDATRETRHTHWCSRKTSAMDSAETPGDCGRTGSCWRPLVPSDQAINLLRFSI